MILLASVSLACHAHAVQQTITARQDAFLIKAENALQKSGAVIIDQARTDRFALIYAKHAEGSFITMTLRSLPPDDTRINFHILTDSPRDIALERRLLRQLSFAVDGI